MDDLTPCGHCGELHEPESLTAFDGELLCEDCLDTSTLTCSRCGDRIWETDNVGSMEHPLCEHCYDTYYCTCEECGRLIPVDDVYYEDGCDEAYCETCFRQRESQIHLHDYNYKPDPLFYGEGSRFLGVELEIDGAGRDSYNAEQLEEVGNHSGTYLYIKSDGSLEDGLEIVTHSMTLSYHTSTMPWEAVLMKALELGYLSHKTSTCGLHVHVNRDSFGFSYEQQEACIARVLFLVERFWQELITFSRRTERSLQRWANRYGVKDSPGKVLDTAKKGYGGRYTCVNITNRDTIEFRIFRGTLRYSTLLATLQMVCHLCEIAERMDDETRSLLAASRLRSSSPI